MKKKILKNKIIKIISGQGCDKCDEIDGDYHKTVFSDGQQLKYDPKLGCFICPRGHRERVNQAFRQETRESFCDRILEIIKVLRQH